MNIHYWTPTLNQKETVRIIGNPFQVWQDWKQKNGRWICYSYPTAASAPQTAKLAWMIPINIQGIVCLWRVGRILMKFLIDIQNDSGQGQWEWLYNYDLVVLKEQPPGHPFPLTTAAVKPQMGAAVSSLTPSEERDLLLEYWENAKQEKEAPPRVVDHRDKKVVKILKKIGYKNKPPEEQ